MPKLCIGGTNMYIKVPPKMSRHMFEILAVERMEVAFDDVDAFASSVIAATLHYECSR